MKKIVVSLIICTGVIAMLLTNKSCTTIEESTFSNDRITASPQFHNKQFSSGTKALTMTAKDYISSTWQFIFNKNNQTPKDPLPMQKADLSYFNTPKKDTLSSTWLGHSSVMIRIGQYKIITDPVFEQKVSVIGPKRFNKGFPLTPEQLTDIDVIIISHDHYDHLNKETIQRLSGVTKTFIVPLAVGQRLVSWGIPEEKIIELDWWENYMFDNGLTITATPAQHFSGRGINDRNKTLWASWVIQTPEYKLFFSGDSGYFNGFKEIGDKLGPFDITYMECGAYNKLWQGVHMFPEETVQAHIDLKGKILHPIHWGTFNLSVHPWYEPMQRLKIAAKANHIQTATPMAGQTIIYNSAPYGSDWWQAALNHKNRSQTQQEN